MTYEYQCVKCEHTFDVIKPVKEIDVNEFCPKCEAPAERKFTPLKIHLFGTKVEDAEYNPALGQVVKGKRHREEIAKRKGLVEIGNDFGSGEKHQAYFDEQRRIKREKSWETD